MIKFFCYVQPQFIRKTKFPYEYTFIHVNVNMTVIVRDYKLKFNSENFSGPHFINYFLSQLPIFLFSYNQTDVEDARRKKRQNKRSEIKRSLLLEDLANDDLSSFGYDKREVRAEDEKRAI